MEECVEENQPVALRLAGTEAEPGQANLGKKLRKVGRRACDGCIVCKVKCSETLLCVRCVKVGIVCTFNRQPRKRGPYQLREKTI